MNTHSRHFGTEKAVFVDRDGTINEEMGYINHEARFRLLPGSLEALKLLKQDKFRIVVITNQGGIARGYVSEEVVHKMHDKLRRDCAAAGVEIDGIYYCPHHPGALVKALRVACQCRKPAPGLIQQAAEALNLDLKGSYLVGDKYSDLQAAWNAGTGSVLVKTGYGLGEVEYGRARWTRHPDCVAEDLLEAARWIVAHARGPNTTAGDTIVPKGTTPRAQAETHI